MKVSETYWKTLLSALIGIRLMSRGSMTGIPYCKAPVVNISRKLAISSARRSATELVDAAGRASDWWETSVAPTINNQTVLQPRRGFINAQETKRDGEDSLSLRHSRHWPLKTLLPHSHQLTIICWLLALNHLTRPLLCPWSFTRPFPSEVWNARKQSHNPLWSHYRIAFKQLFAKVRSGIY